MNGKWRLPNVQNDLSQNILPFWREPLHIAVIVEDLRPPFDEGAKKTCFSLIDSFRKHGIKVSVFTWHNNPELQGVFPLPANKFLVSPSFARSLKAQSPNVILYIPTSAGTMGAFARAAMIKIQSPGAPLALLSLQYRELPSYARRINLCQYADLVFTQSQASTDVFESVGCKTILLPGGVDHTSFQPASQEQKRLLRSQHGFQDADRIVLHIGHCNRNRNVIVLRRLAEAGFKVILIASTSTDVDQDLLVSLREAGVTVITAFVECIQHYYQLSDCDLFPVFNPTSAIDVPLSILEAMACNLPIVTTRFGALPAMFQPGGGLYFGDTEEDIVGLVAQAIEQQDCRTSEMVANYSWDRAAQTILDAFQEAGVA